MYIVSFLYHISNIFIVKLSWNYREIEMATTYPWKWRSLIREKGFGWIG